MINTKTKEEWQQIVNNFTLGKQSQKAYCKERNINYRSFKYWYYKLKPVASLTKEERTALKADVLPEVTKEIANKEFVGFRLVPSITKIKLPNGINIEVAGGDVVGLIQKLFHVA